MANVIGLRAAVDGALLYVVPGVALVTPYQTQETKKLAAGQPPVPVGPPQTIIGEAVVQFVGLTAALHVKGTPGDIAVLISGKETAKELT